MTELSREILANWQVRKTKKQKAAFFEFLKSKFPELRAEPFKGLTAGQNLVLGNVETAKVVFTAHYDTCARLPFPNFITPKNILVYLLYQILILAPIFLLMFGVDFLVLRLTDNGLLAYWCSLAVILTAMFLLFDGPANRHTVNDNTSGVLTLVELYQKLTPAERAGTAIVFFDHEETGLVGSAAFKRKYKNVMRNKFLVNFDCVSDGNHFLFVLSRKAKESFGQKLQESFAQPEGKTCWFETNSTAFYPSDNAHFTHSVGVAAMQKKKGLGLYMNKIHTRHDTVMQEENVAFFAQGARRLLAEL